MKCVDCDREATATDGTRKWWCLLHFPYEAKGKSRMSQLAEVMSKLGVPDKYMSKALALLQNAIERAAEDAAHVEMAKIERMIWEGEKSGNVIQMSDARKGN